MTKDRIIQAVQRCLEEQAASLITEEHDYRLARDIVEELDDLDRSSDDEKWAMATEYCREWAEIIPHDVLLKDEDGQLILAGAGEKVDKP